MQAMLIYILKVIAVSGLLLLYYITVLCNNRFHFYNRFYLLFTVALSLLLPLLHFDWFYFNSHSIKAINLYKIIYQSTGEDFVVTGKSSFNWQQSGFIILIISSAFLLLHLVFRIIKIYRLKRIYPVNKLADFDFVNTDLQSAPFSFLRTIFWRKDIQLTESTGKQILQHEITHIRQKHSLDKIFTELVLCFCWMNPFFWWLKKELYLIHEFIADERSVENKDATAFAQMLLAAQFGQFNFLPAQSFFYSSIKRRLIMFTTSKKSQLNYLRRIMVLPLLACVICLFAFSVRKETPVLSAKKIVAVTPFKLVVDAGHGGKDFGALGNNLSEKDVALKIAEEISSLSTLYGIDVVLTRNDDRYMSPQQKSDFANAQNADAFISVHVNTNTAEHPNQSGFELYLAKRNTKNLGSSQVLGSAILQNMSTEFKAVQTLGQRQVGIWVLENSNIPAVLMECGYITNSEDAKNLKDDARIELMAKNILQGIAMYANNKVDKSQIYQLQNINAGTNIPTQSTAILQPQAEPLYVLDGEFITRK